jgi:hypothetical protein
MNPITRHETKAGAMRAARRTDGWATREITPTGAWAFFSYPDDEAYVLAHYGDESAEDLYAALAALRAKRRRFFYGYEVVEAIPAHAP